MNDAKGDDLDCVTVPIGCAAFAEKFKFDDYKFDVGGYREKTGVVRALKAGPRTQVAKELCQWAKQCGRILPHSA